MVLSTLLSAPLMFISAQMCLLDFSSAKAHNFEHLLKRAMIDVSGTAIPFGVSNSTKIDNKHQHYSGFLSQTHINLLL